MSHASVLLVIYAVHASADVFYWTGAVVWIAGALWSIAWMLSLIARAILRMNGVTAESVLQLRANWRVNADVAEFITPKKKKP